MSGRFSLTALAALKYSRTPLSPRSLAINKNCIFVGNGDVLNFFKSTPEPFTTTDLLSEVLIIPKF